MEFEFGINLDTEDNVGGIGGVKPLPPEEQEKVMPIAEVVQPQEDHISESSVGNIAILATAADFVRCLATEVAEDGDDLADNINGLHIGDESICELTLQVLREHFQGTTKLNLEHGRRK